MLHIPDERSRKLIAEPDLSKDVLCICLDRNVLVDHGDLLSVECEFALVNVYATPEILHFLLDCCADLRDAVHLLEWCNLG